MIIKKLPKPDDIVTIRLVSGDEVVGKLMATDRDAADVTLLQPIAAVMQPTRDGHLTLAFAPFLASTDETAEVTFPATAILCRPMLTRKDVADGYTKTVEPASAIIQPPKGLFIP
jgi:hypothetical protein